MSDIVCYDSDGSVLDHYTQWDLNRTIKIKGADTSSAPIFYFGNSLSSEAIPVTSIMVNEEISAPVPNVLLQDALPLQISMYYTMKDGSKKTLYSIRVPVEPRKKPSDYVYMDNVSGIIINSTDLIISDDKPSAVSVLWFNTGIDE